MFYGMWRSLVAHCFREAEKSWFSIYLSQVLQVFKGIRSTVSNSNKNRTQILGLEGLYPSLGPRKILSYLMTDNRQIKHLILGFCICR